MKKQANNESVANAVDACLYAAQPNIRVEMPKEAKNQVWIRLRNQSFLSGSELERINKCICKPGYLVSVCAQMAYITGIYYEPYINVVLAIDGLKEEFLTR